MPPKYDYRILSAALEGLELQRGRLDEQIRRVRALLSTMEPPADAAGIPGIPSPPEPRLTPAGRQAIAEAQRRRWEAERAAKAERAAMPVKTATKAKKRG